MGKKIPLADRLRDRAEWIGECLIWNGCVGRDGYPIAGFGHGKSFRLTRVVWMDKHGPIDSGLLVCHKCDTPRCVNIEHLFLGTPLENSRDMVRKGRRPATQGDKHFNTKIPDCAVPAVISRRAAGEKLASIAADYGVHFATISYICRGLRKCA